MTQHCLKGHAANVCTSQSQLTQFQAVLRPTPISSRLTLPYYYATSGGPCPPWPSHTNPSSLDRCSALSSVLSCSSSKTKSFCQYWPIHWRAPCPHQTCDPGKGQAKHTPRNLALKRDSMNLWQYLLETAAHRLLCKLARSHNFTRVAQHHQSRVPSLQSLVEPPSGVTKRHSHTDTGGLLRLQTRSSKNCSPLAKYSPCRGSQGQPYATHHVGNVPLLSATRSRTMFAQELAQACASYPAPLHRHSAACWESRTSQLSASVVSVKQGSNTSQFVHVKCQVSSVKHRECPQSRSKSWSSCPDAHLQRLKRRSMSLGKRCVGQHPRPIPGIPGQQCMPYVSPKHSSMCVSSFFSILPQELYHMPYPIMIPHILPKHDAIHFEGPAGAASPLPPSGVLFTQTSSRSRPPQAEPGERSRAATVLPPQAPPPQRHTP